MEDKDGRAETRKCGYAETHSQYRDVCVLIPRPSHPLFIGFRCRILRQTSSHCAPPSWRHAHSFSNVVYFFYRFFFITSRSPNGVSIFSPFRFSFSDPFTLKASVNLFAKICRVTNFKRHVYRINRVNATANITMISLLLHALSLFHLMKVSETMNGFANALSRYGRVE